MKGTDAYVGGLRTCKVAAAIALCPLGAAKGVVVVVEDDDDDDDGALCDEATSLTLTSHRMWARKTGLRKVVPER
jgi:hypothetical protein